MNEFNVEFAHIYADQEFGQEQIKSILKLKKVVQELQKKKKSFSSVVLIDEYSPPVCTLDEKYFLNKILEHNLSPDFIVYESQPCKVAETVIKLLPKNSLQMQKFNNKKVLLLVTKGKKIGLKDNFGKYTCSLLIAAWILVRFGVLQLSSLKKLKNKELSANRLITILPQKYKETEQKVLEILAVTKYKYLIKNIKYEFF